MINKLLHFMNIILYKGMSTLRILYYKVRGVNVSIYSTIESGCEIGGGM